MFRDERELGVVHFLAFVAKILFYDHGFPISNTVRASHKADQMAAKHH